MPLLDVAVEKWRRWRGDVARSEESRQNIHRQLRINTRRQDYEKIAYLLWEADGKPENAGNRYYLEAEKRLSGFRWHLYKLHQPFIRLEKKAIEPLDHWADRANIFQFFAKISPIVEAFGVLAIPIVVLAFEIRQEQRQQRFEQSLISAQTNVRQQQAVRDYLSHVTTIHLESDQEKKLQENEELQKLLAANTLALFYELSVREDAGQGSTGDKQNAPLLDYSSSNQDRKGQVVESLSGLGWINSSEDQQPLISLSKAKLEEANLKGAKLEGAKLEGAKLERAKLERANLKGANLFGADLFEANLFGANLSGAKLEKVFLEGANLFGADLFGADLFEANLFGANLFVARLERANLSGAKLEEANLSGANLSEANLSEVNLFGANLSGANLSETDNLSNRQIKSACHWEQAIYTPAQRSKDLFGFELIPLDPAANQAKIASIRQDKASDPQNPPNCG